jgi:anti-anti-sigma factor
LLREDNGCRLTAQTRTGQVSQVTDLVVQLDPSRGEVEVVAARDRLRTWLTEVGLGAPVLHEVLIAVGEATTNAVEHSGSRPGPDGEPAVVLQANLCDNGLLRVRVIDRGRWRERSPGAGARLNRGRGQLLMRGLVDRFEVRTGPEGTVVELVKEHTAVSNPPAPLVQLQQMPGGVLVVTGEVDLSAAPQLREALGQLPLPVAGEQVLDLRRVTYLDSAGTAIIWQHPHRLRLLVTEDSAVATVARISGLTDFATVEFRP